MVRGILADNNVLGHLAILQRIWQNAFWCEVWDTLNLRIYTLPDIGLDTSAPDPTIWQECQARQFVLVTANRNDDGPDSLETTIRDQNTASSLPVITLADAKRIQHDRDYANRVAVKLLQYLFEIDVVRGTGRLFVP